MSCDYGPIWRETRAVIRRRMVQIRASAERARAAGRESVAQCRQSDIDTLTWVLRTMRSQAASMAQRARRDRKRDAWRRP